MSMILYICLLMIKLKTSIMNGLGLIILASLFQSYACSGLCSVNLTGCGEEKQQLSDCCSRPASTTDNQEEPEPDCQEEHFAFLQTLAQFHSFSTFEITQIVSVLDNGFSTSVGLPMFTNYSTIQVFTGFVPPPPKDGIPVLIQSFLI